MVTTRISRRFCRRSPAAFSAATGRSFITPLRGKTTDWRAGCGRSASPVRREGEPTRFSLPLSRWVSWGKITIRKVVTNYGWKSCRESEAKLLLTRHPSGFLQCRGDPCGRPPGPRFATIYWEHRRHHRQVPFPFRRRHIGNPGRRGEVEGVH